MFPVSTSKLIWPDGLEENSDLPLTVERYIAGIGQPCAFRADGNFTNDAYVQICDGRSIHREMKRPGGSTQNAHFENSI